MPEITEKVKELIIEAVIQHSDKKTNSGNPYVEMLKDVDSIDRQLHGIETKDEYFERCNNVYMSYVA